MKTQPVRVYLRTGNYSGRDTCSGVSEGLMSGVSLYFERRQNKSTYFDPIANIAGASSFDVDTFINGIREKIASCSRPYENPENVLRNIDWLIRQPGLALWSRDAENRVVVKFLDGTYDGSGDRDRYCRHYLAAITAGLSFHKILEETETNNPLRYLSKSEAEKIGENGQFIIDEEVYLEKLSELEKE